MIMVFKGLRENKYGQKEEAGREVAYIYIYIYIYIKFKIRLSYESWNSISSNNDTMDVDSIYYIPEWLFKNSLHKFPSSKSN
jgi:hypothetical protein